jgi:hypothetical protein
MPRSGSSTLPPHSRAITGIACSAKSCICECAPTGRAARCRPQMVRLLLTGWLVGAANLPRLLPDAGDLLHCEEARHLDVLNGTGGYSDTGDSGCHSGVSLRSGLATLLAPPENNWATIGTSRPTRPSGALIRCSARGICSTNSCRT